MVDKFIWAANPFSHGDHAEQWLEDYVTARSGLVPADVSSDPSASVEGESSLAEPGQLVPSDNDEATPVAPAFDIPVLSATDTTDIVFYAPPLPVVPERRRDRWDRDGDPFDERGSSRRRQRRRPGDEGGGTEDGSPNVRSRAPRETELITEPQRVKGSTRLEAKKQRRRDGRDASRRRTVVTESEFLARREAVERLMVVRERADRTQIGVLEDGVLVEHYVARASEASLIGNVYLGKVQNVLPSMEAAFVDIGRGRNAVLYSGEVDWDAVDGSSQSRRIELALKPGDKVLVQVTKDPVGHKGARLTSQVSLPGRYLVYVPNSSMNGISRKLPEPERQRLKKILKEVLPENVGVIVRTAAEGASEEQLRTDVARLTAQWSDISAKVDKGQAPALLHSEPDLLVKIIRDVFNEDFTQLVIDGSSAAQTIRSYLAGVAPELLERVLTHEAAEDSFATYRVTEQIEKALDRKVWLPSGGSLVIDRTEAMTVIDVNTGKFVGSGGNLEETVTKNNLEAAEEIVRQLRLRDIGGIIVVDFIDMVLESNRDLVQRRLIECLSRDRTKHQVAEITSLGLVQMTRKKLGLGLLETFSEPCEVCAGRGVVVFHEPVTRSKGIDKAPAEKSRRGRGGRSAAQAPAGEVVHAIPEGAKNALAKIAASTLHHSGANPDTVSEEGANAESSEIVEILDIPVAVTKGRGRQSSPEATVALETVLDALPEPSEPGHGRGRRRRVTTDNISTDTGQAAV